jgi:hypothetical protein
MTDEDEDYVCLGDLDYRDKLHALATVILLEEGGPLADQLLAMEPIDTDAPLTEMLDDLARREDFLRSTLAWILAGQILATRRGPAS